MSTNGQYLAHENAVIQTKFALVFHFAFDKVVLQNFTTTTT